MTELINFAGLRSSLDFFNTTTFSQRCTSCGGTNLHDDWKYGDTVCTDCGACAPERLADVENEGSRSFTADVSSTNVKSKSITEKTDKYFGTVGNTHAVSKKDDTATVDSLNQVQKQQTDPKIKRLQDGIHEIANLCDNLRIVRAKDYAIAKWIQFEKERKKHSRGGEKHMYAALIFLACKECNVARTFDEIANVSGLSKKEIVKCYKRLIKQDKTHETTDEVELSRKSRILHTESVADVIISRINRIATSLNLTFPQTQAACTLVESLCAKLEGKKPDTIAAVCIFMTAIQEKLGITKKQIALASRISTNTLRAALESVGHQE